MTNANPTATSAGGARARTHNGVVPAYARQLAAQLSALFQHDTEIVKQLNDAHQRLRNANERLWSGLTRDALDLIHDGTAATTIATSPIAARIHDHPPTVTPDALQQIHWQIHRAFCAYQHAAEQRRQLAVDVGELSHQLTQTLSAVGWSTDDARRANVHALADTTP